MPRKGENIYKRKDGRWEGRYKCGYDDSGKAKYRSVYAGTYFEVKEKLTALKASTADTASSGALTVKELFEEWLGTVRLRVKDSTYSCYLMKINKHILPEFGGIRYDMLSAQTVHSFIERRLNSGLSAKYVADIIVVFKTMAKYISRVHNYRDPLADVVLPKSEKRNMGLLSETEQKRLALSAVSEVNTTKIGVLLSYYAGLRIGEVCGLKWSDIDLEKSILTIRRTVQRISANGGTRLYIGSPKSSSSARSIPLPEFLVEILRQYRTADSAYVLSGTEKMIEPRTMQYRFKSFLKKADLPSINYHSLRHMFATNCIKLGFDVKTLSEILGHSSVEVTLNRYIHSSLERKAACMSLLTLAV